MTGYIYGLFCTCHPDEGIRYVGQTTQDLNKRLYQHSTNGSRPVTVWATDHTVQILALEQGPVEGLSHRERFWIRVFDTYNTGFNRMRSTSRTVVAPSKPTVPDHCDNGNEVVPIGVRTVLANLTSEGMTAREFAFTIGKPYSTAKRYLTQASDFIHVTKTYPRPIYRLKE